MYIGQLLSDVIFPAYRMLPEGMGHLRATLQLTATAVVESNLQERFQKPNGPAVGLWQFEKIAIRDVMARSKSQPIARDVCNRLGVPFNENRIYLALKKPQHDILAAVFARLNYWNDTGALPDAGKVEAAYKYYLKVWRPAKPDHARWVKSYWRAYGALIG